MKLFIRFSLLLACFFLPALARADYASTVASFSPLAWWRFNETSSSPALNIASNSATSGPTINGNIVLDVTKGQSGIVGNAARFVNAGNVVNYCGSKIDVPYDAAINPAPPFTIEFWAKPNTLGGDDPGFCPLSSINPNYYSVNRSGWLFYLNNSGQWQFRLGSETNYVATIYAGDGFASAGVWQHVVATYNGTVAKIFVNGVQVANMSLSAAASAAFRRNTQSPLRIGGTPLSGNLSSWPACSVNGTSGIRGFDGWLDEVAIYATELSAGTIAAHYAAATTNNAGYGAQVLTANPVGYWRLNESAAVAPAATAFVTLTNSGTLGAAANGTNTWGSLTAQAGPAQASLGANNSAMTFCGSSGYVNLPAAAGLNFSGNITLLAWVKPTQRDFFHDILAHGYDGAKAETFLRISRGGGNSGYGDGTYYEVGVADGSTYYDSAKVAIPDGDIGNWVFLAGTYDGANWNLYRNGQLAAAIPSTHGAKTVTSAWAVGSRSAPSAAAGLNFSGSIDEPAIFSNALSAANILAIYNAAQVKPYFTRTPQLPAGSIYAGTTLNLNAWAEGNATLAYQWFKNGSPLAGQTGTNLTLSSVTIASNGTYSVVVTNVYGTVTGFVTLAVLNTAPIITQQPQSKTNYETFADSLTVVAEGTQPLSYQWKKDGVDLPGETSSALTFPALTSGDSGDYSVGITNPVGGQLSAVATLAVVPLPPDADVQIAGTPDYNWYAGCFGTACGNLMGFWDRNGMQDFYTGPTAGGVAPLDNCGTNIGIRALWATKAGFDGRPANSPGHIDDYWVSYTIAGSCGGSDGNSYESTLPDPYVLSNRVEHAADCIGDFIGLSQRRWTNLNSECDGNIDAFSFVYWDTDGAKRVNYVPLGQGTNAGRDIPSGLRAWTRWRGYDADVFSQLVDFNPNCPAGQGFTFADLRREIDAGYPVLVFLQNYFQFARTLNGVTNLNPEIHGMLIYGYQAYAAFGTNVYCRTSWGSGNDITYNWSSTPWVNGTLSVRGVIGFHPKPKIRSIQISGGDVTLRWDGSAAVRYDVLNSSTTPLNWYQLERSLSLDPSDFQPVGPATTDLAMVLPVAGGSSVFYRVRQLAP